MEATPKSDFFRVSINIWGLLTAAVAIGIFCSLASFLSPLYWAFDVFPHFRIQYFLLLVTGGSLLLWKGRKKVAIPALILGLANLILILPLYYGGQDTSLAQGPQTKAMLLNVNTSHGDPKTVGAYILKTAPDILVLEEISDKWVDELADLLKSYPYSEVRSRSDNFGIGLYSKLPLEKSEVLYLDPRSAGKDGEGSI